MGIRDYIINNFKDENKQGIKSAITESISENEEMTLPGLGVLFEILWKNSNEDLKEEIITTIFNNIKNKK